MTYSNSLAAGRERYAARNQNNVSMRTASRAIGPVSNTIVLVVLISLLGLLYLTQVTKTNAYGYDINQLTEQKTSLEQQFTQLEVEQARLQAINRVASSAVVQNMVDATPQTTLSN